jgi:hypothetical protein
MAKRTLTADELISEITDILHGNDGEFIEDIANQILSHKVTYIEDSLFEQEVWE